MAGCPYCFGPHTGPVMSHETLADTLRFMDRILTSSGSSKVKVTFHGDAPLVAGVEFW